MLFEVSGFVPGVLDVEIGAKEDLAEGGLGRGEDDREVSGDVELRNVRRARCITFLFANFTSQHHLLLRR